MVIRGKSKPLLVDTISSIADVSGGVPVVLMLTWAKQLAAGNPDKINTNQKQVMQINRDAALLHRQQAKIDTATIAALLNPLRCHPEYSGVTREGEKKSNLHR